MSIYPEALQHLLAFVETSYGDTAETFTLTEDLRYVENPVIKIPQVPIKRTGPSPFRGGFRPVAGPKLPTWALDAELSLRTIAAATDLPVDDVWLASGGFGAPVYLDTVGPPSYRTQTYTLLTANHRSIALRHQMRNAANDDSIEKIIRGARANWNLNINAAERVMMNLTGEGVNPNGPVSTGAGAPAVNYGVVDANFGRLLPAPQFAGGLVATLTPNAASGQNPYPAGGRCLSFSLDGNMNPQRQVGIKGTFGIQEFILAPTGPTTGTLVLEVSDIDSPSFDAWGLQSNPDPFVLKIGKQSVAGVLDASVDPAGATALGDFCIYEGTWYIDVIDVAPQEGAEIWTLSLMGGYPESGGDGGGLLPAELFTIQYGTVYAV